MEQILLAFITGLTTGGLSCLAVQGGLLTTSLAGQIEQTFAAGSAGKRTSRPRPKTALPIALFLGAKVFAYTLLGALLGWLGSAFTLSETARALLLMAVGIFMLGNALRMLNVHPIFRYFIFEPPKAVTRYLRRASKQTTDWFSPVFLGALTVLIPCGVTQAMMVVALGTGSAMQGAAILLAFTLGASPLFFAVAYFATQLGSRLEGMFTRFVALVLLVLGLLSIENGLNLMGSPISFANLTRGFTQSQSAPPVQGGETLLTLNAENNGYLPQTLYAKADAPITLNIVTQDTYSCARDFVIPALRFNTLLPETGLIPVEIPPQPAGTTMRFTCSMGMYTGQIIFTP
ncbi:MAG: hypothetical protein OHK0052_22920 [Anaerolineales bacterium]